MRQFLLQVLPIPIKSECLEYEVGIIIFLNVPDDVFTQQNLGTSGVGKVSEAWRLLYFGIPYFTQNVPN